MRQVRAQRSVLSPTARWLIDAASAWAGDAAGSRSDESGRMGPESAEILDLARKNRVAGVLGGPHAPADRTARFALEAERLWNRRRASDGRHQLAALGEAFQRVGIAPLVYKGLDFDARYWPDSEPRVFTDLDLIVPVDHFEQAAEVLESLGYQPPPGSRPLSYYRRFHLHAVFVRSGEPFPVELHFALDSPYAGLPDCLGAIFQDAGRASDLGSSLLRPSACDALLLMAVHLEKTIGLAATLPSREARLCAVLDGGALAWVLDVVLWLRRCSGKEGARVVKRARGLRLERSLIVALRLAHDLDRDAVPEWAEEPARRLPGGTPVLARIVYPDLSRGRAPGAVGRRVRHTLRHVPRGLGWRPLRVLEWLLPQFTVPGTSRPRGARWAQWRLLIANAAAVATTRRTPDPAHRRS